MSQLMIKNPTDAYKKQRILTASPSELIVLLYEGLKKNLLLAQRFFRRDDPSAAYSSLLKAQDIITELVNCLDMSVPMSEDLLDLYEFLIISMAKANLAKDAEMLTPLIEIVGDLKEAWEGVAAAAERGTLELVNE